MKACLTCAHFDLSFGYAGYSEMTPGSPPSIGCMKAGARGCAWPRGNEGGVSVPTFISIAENCRHYEEHPALKETSGG